MPRPIDWRLADAPPVPDGERRWGLVDVWVWLVVAQFAAIVWSSVVVASRHGSEVAQRPDPLPIATIFLGAFGLWLFYGLGPWLSTTKRGGGFVSDLGLQAETSDIPIGLVLGVVVQFAVSALYWPLGQLTDIDLGERARTLIESADTPTELLMLTLLVVVGAPLAEELFYRGLVLRALVPRVGAWPAILLSAALFALVHAQLLEFAGLFVFGVVAGFLAVSTGRLVVSWALHVGFNAAALLVLILTH